MDAEIVNNIDFFSVILFWVFLVIPGDNFAFDNLYNLF
jgi:hypothetical protein